MQNNKPQLDKFKAAARELETDDDEKRFDQTLGKIAKPPTETDKSDKDKPAK